MFEHPVWRWWWSHLRIVIPVLCVGGFLVEASSDLRRLPALWIVAGTVALIVGACLLLARQLQPDDG